MLFVNVVLATSFYQYMLRQRSSLKILAYMQTSFFMFRLQNICFIISKKGGKNSLLWIKISIEKMSVALKTNREYWLNNEHTVLWNNKKFPNALFESSKKNSKHSKSLGFIFPCVNWKYVCSFQYKMKTIVFESDGLVGLLECSFNLYDQN